MKPSPIERDVLERAVATGRIDPSDYEAAHQRFAQCMIEHGFQPSFRKTADGLYVELPYLSVENQEVLAEAKGTCSGDNSVVEMMYRIQQGNPDLLADSRLVAVQCLKSAGFVSATYSVEDFDRDRAANQFPFDPYTDVVASDCLYEAGYAYFSVG